MESFSELAAKRRSHRKFSPEKVAEKDIRSLLSAALMSPSGHGSRKWHFILVSDPGAILSLSQVREHGSAFLSSAPLVIAVLGEPSEQPTWIEDCSIAAVSIQYQAEDLGLGSCWCQIRGREGSSEGETAEAMVRNILEIPDNHSVLCLIGIGKPLDERKKQEEGALEWDKIHNDKF